MNAQKLLISQQNSILFIESDKIIYLQSENCYTTIYLQGGKKVIVCKPLSKLQQELEPHIFIRVSQSFVINRYLIERIDKKKKCIDLKEDHSIGYTVALKNLLTMINQT
jgi:two-component system LytT family response regulator